MCNSFPRTTPTLLPDLPRAQDAPFPDARGDAPLIEKLQKRNRVLPGNAQQILDVGRSDLLALAQERDELRLDRVERAGVKEERFLHPHELAGLHEHLEQLVLFVAAEPRPAQRPLGTPRSGLRL